MLRAEIDVVYYILFRFKQMTMPVLLMPAGNDPITYQPGGEVRS